MDTRAKQPIASKPNYYEWQYAARARVRNVEDQIDQFHMRCVELEGMLAATELRAAQAEAQVQALNAELAALKLVGAQRVAAAEKRPIASLKNAQKGHFKTR